KAVGCFTALVAVAAYLYFFDPKDGSAIDWYGTDFTAITNKLFTPLWGYKTKENKELFHEFFDKRIEETSLVLNLQNYPDDRLGDKVVDTYSTGAQRVRGGGGVEEEDVWNYQNAGNVGRMMDIRARLIDLMSDMGEK